VIFKISKFAILVVITLILWGCITTEDRKYGLNSQGEYFLNIIVDENPGSHYEIVLDKVYGEDDGIYESTRGFFVRLFVDTQVVLTNTIDSLRIYGVYHESNTRQTGFLGIAIKSDTLNTIKIFTDDVIAVQSLGLGQCNITTIPPEIGKIRTQSLALEGNNIVDVPNEITQLLDGPQIYPYTTIRMDRSFYEALSDTLKIWFDNVYSNQDFPD